MKPLLIPADRWRSRWLVLPSWRRLHRVAKICGGVECFEDWPTATHGATVCGQRGKLTMPGILSRMGLQRCARCCELLGIPRGDGAPFNACAGEDKEK